MLQTGHFPFIAGFPFFIVTFTAAGSSLFARHFTQYMLAIIFFTSPRRYNFILCMLFNYFIIKDNTISPLIATTARMSVLIRSRLIEVSYGWFDSTNDSDGCAVLRYAYVYDFTVSWGCNFLVAPSGLGAMGKRKPESLRWY